MKVGDVVFVVCYHSIQCRTMVKSLDGAQGELWNGWKFRVRDGLVINRSGRVRAWTPEWEALWVKQCFGEFD